MAGLSAAIELQRLDFDVVVLEARDRVGGRCYTETWQSTVKVRAYALMCVRVCGCVCLLRYTSVCAYARVCGHDHDACEHTQYCSYAGVVCAIVSDRKVHKEVHVTSSVQIVVHQYRKKLIQTNV